MFDKAQYIAQFRNITNNTVFDCLGEENDWKYVKKGTRFPDQHEFEKIIKVL